MSTFSKFLTATIVALLLGTPSLRADGFMDIIGRIKNVLRSAQQTFQDRIQRTGINTPTPEFAAIVKETTDRLNSPEILEKIEGNLALRALHIQTLNHLKHVGFNFEIRGQGYPHDLVLEGPYPYRPTLLALEKAAEFFKIVSTNGAVPTNTQAKNPEREKQLLDEQKAVVKRVINDSFATYEEMRGRLIAQGLNASWPEFQSMVEYLDLTLRTNDLVLRHSSQNKYVAAFRLLALGHLAKVKSQSHPYLSTLEAIQRSLEFLDIVHRANDPSRSPQLYHSGRYEYYTHFLEASAPDNIMLPTLTSLGATDILKARGVPISMIGVNTGVTWVDGYYQTPYEFYVHDINHTRRMWQFLKEDARAKGLSIEEYARRSDDFVKKRLIPLISINKTDDEVTKNRKRLRKVLLFEILHEDALPAAADVIQKAVLRPPNQLTPFERTEGDAKVEYIMEPGATTLAYVYRKLAHDFYDMPGERIDNIVSPGFRTRENIIEAAEAVFGALEIQVPRETFEFYVTTDEGFPEDFRNTLVRDIEARAKETIPLVNVRHAIRRSIESLKSQVQFAISDVPVETESGSVPVIKSIAHNGKNVSVNLELTLKDHRKIDYQIQIPQEQLASDKSVGTIDQIKGNKRVIEIESGSNFVLERLQPDFLSKLDPTQHWVAVKANDPKATEIIRIAESSGFETIMIGSATQNVESGSVLPTFYAMAANEGEMTKMWDSLISNDAENIARHVRVNFNEVSTGDLPALADSVNHSRIEIQNRLKEGLQQRHIPIVNQRDIDREVLKGRTPVLFSGASKKSWPVISESNQREVIRAVQESLSHLDPKKVVIVTGATDYGVEKIVHEEARKRGFTVLGTVVELAGAEEVGPVTHVTTMGNSWFGKSRPVLQFIEQHHGYVIFMGGGEILKDEIHMANNLGVTFYLMKGPEGAANDLAPSMPEHTFQGADGLTARIRNEHPEQTKVSRVEQVQTYRKLIGENFQDASHAENFSRVVTSYRAFKYRIFRMIGESPFVAMEALGFSGAGYSDINLYKADFQKRVIDNYKLAKQKGGKGAKLVVIMGGTVDGFGAGYEVLHQLRSQGYTDIVVTGMSSSEAAQYHLEGHEKDWGDVISPHQDLLLLLDTHQDTQGNQSWELKEQESSSSRTADILLDLGKHSNSIKASMDIFEGEEQAFKAGVEFAARSEGSNADNRELVLHVGYQPAPQQAAKGKDKGFRAALDMAKVLIHNPEMTKGVTVRAGHPGADLATLQKFAKRAWAYISSELAETKDDALLMNGIINTLRHAGGLTGTDAEVLDKAAADLSHPETSSMARRAKVRLAYARTALEVLTQSKRHLEHQKIQTAELDKHQGHPMYELGPSDSNAIAAKVKEYEGAIETVDRVIEKVKAQIREKEAEVKIK